MIKIGSALFVDQATGTLDRSWLESVCADVSDLRAEGKEVVIVSSGAVALGARELKLDPRRARLEDKQAAAATGQIVLAHAYQEVLGGFGITAAQVLLTLDDSESRRRYLNASKTLLSLLGYGVVPVVNENDTVATQELRYGDNDRLAARVAQMVSAECLVLLSDVDGLYTANPRVDDTARHIEEVTELKREHLGHGRRARLEPRLWRDADQARRCADRSRRRLPDGDRERPHRAADRRAARGRQGHVVLAERDARRRAQAVDRGHAEPEGRRARRSRRGARARLGPEPVAGRCRGRRRPVRARRRGPRARPPTAASSRAGSIAYAADEARLIAGKQTAGIADVLGYRGRDEIIHRDDLVLIDTR